MSRDDSTREQEVIQGGTSGTLQGIFESIQVSELRKQADNISRQVSTSLPRQGEQGSHDSPRD